MPNAVIFDIQRFSLHDGPGIRTTVFFKGCPLSCQWCQNPESRDPGPEMAFYAESCQGCLSCRQVCPREAILEGDTARIEFSRCDACGQCVPACPTKSLRQIGQEWSPDRLVEEVVKDRDFFQDSGGGVTLSGGEPVLQQGFLKECLPGLKEQGIHINLETAGKYPWERLAGLLDHLDLIFFDLKHMDDASHKVLTGASNQTILENFTRLAGEGTPLTARMPLIPGMNDAPENLRATARFLRTQGQDTIHLLKHHNLGEAKLPRIKSPLEPLGLPRLGDEDYDQILATFAREGIHAVLYE